MFTPDHSGELVIIILYLFAFFDYTKTNQYVCRESNLI